MKSMSNAVVGALVAETDDGRGITLFSPSHPAGRSPDPSSDDHEDDTNESDRVRTCDDDAAEAGWVGGWEVVA